MSEESCGNCRFWLGDCGPAGQCRRNPPVVLNEDGECPFPVSWNDQWCGEWRAKGASGTNSKLYQLPNGKWIMSSRVSEVASHTDPRGSYVLVRFGVDVGSHEEIDCPTKEAADAMRDKIAAGVNAMVGSGK